MFQAILPKMQTGDVKALARCISLVENEVEGYEDFLKALPALNVAVVGITGPPGAGKSTLVDALIGHWIAAEKKIGVLCVDPSSPFNLGALLGDRIRMSHWYNHPQVYIRSLATRGSLGGLHPKIIEITDVMKAANFDLILVETVGVGQSEIEIAGLADCTVVVVVPEAGDEVQTMKAGLMEIADLFVVNKADRPGADLFVKNLKQISFANHAPIAVVKTIATQGFGVNELAMEIENKIAANLLNDKKYWLLAEKAFQLIEQKRMKGVSKIALKNDIENEMKNTGGFNLYEFLEGK